MEKYEIDLLRSPNLIVLSSQSYTAMQKDIFTLAISQMEVGLNINKDLFENQIVTVPLKMLSKFSERNYTRLKEECKDMQKKGIEISDDANQSFEFVAVFPRIKYKDGVITLTMFLDVAEKFLELKNGYSTYYIRESLSLDTFNKKRLYEILSVFKNREYPEWFVLDSELKTLLGIVKTKEKNDKEEPKDRFKGRHKEFQERVIELSVNAINDQTSLFISYKREKKDGEWGTRFFIKNKLQLPAAKKQQPIEEYISTLDERQKRLYDMLQKLVVRVDMIKRIIASEDLTKQSFKWFSDNKDNIQNNKYKNAAAILLGTLGLVEFSIKKAKKTVGKE